MKQTDECCCGHLRTYHLSGTGACAMCGARSCPQFHGVGVGHDGLRTALKVAALVAVAVAVWVAAH